MDMENLKQSVKLLDYIGSNGVKKAGTNIYRVDPCPICGHKDHFTIYSDSNSYSSFNGCCQGGSIIDYMMEVEGMSQAQAIEKTKELAGVDKPRQQEKPKQEPEKRMSEEQKKEAFSLIEKARQNSCSYYTMRGLTEKTINKYGLGYIPEGFN